MKRLNKLFNGALVLEGVLFLLGIYLFVKPETSVETLSYILSFIFIIDGVILLSGNNIKTLGLTETALLMITIGLVFLYRPDFLAIIIPLLFGIWILMNGLSRLRVSLLLKDVRYDKWFIPFVLSLIVMFCGMAMLINPSEFSDTIIAFIGIIILFSSISNIITLFIFKKHIKDLSKLIK